MSSSDSESSDSDCSTGWPWHTSGGHKQSDSDDSDSSSEQSSDESSVEETPDESWTNRRNIFISVYSDNLKNTTLITNYNELHTYREKYTKLSKKSADNIKNIWSEVKINFQDKGIIPLKLIEKELVQDTKNVTVKEPTSGSKQNESIVNSTKSPAVVKTQNSKVTATPKSETPKQVNLKVIPKTGNTKTQTNANNVVNKNTKENNSNNKIKNKENESNEKKIAETPKIVEKPIEENKTTIKNSTKDDKKDKGVKVDIAVLNVTKSESDKKNVKNATVKLNGCDKNTETKSNAPVEFKKPQAKSDSNKNKNSKNNSKEITKSKKRKAKNSNSQSSENSDTQKRSASVDSTRTSAKGKAEKKIIESENDTTDDEDEDEEIIDNMDALTGNSKVVNDEMLRLVKHKDIKKKPLETPKVADNKVIQKSVSDQSSTVSSPKSDVNSQISEKSDVYYSEKYAEDAVDMLMENNFMGALESLVEAMQYNPGDDRHYLNRCYCYLRLNRAPLALADAQYVLQTSAHLGHRFIALLRAGQASMALQKYTQAENYFKDSLSINPDNPFALREHMRAKISRLVSLGYTERNAVIALLKYSKTQEAMSYLANRKIANNENHSDDDNRNYDNVDDSDDLVYSSDEDEKPNCTTLVNNMLNYEPLTTKLFHLLAKPVNLSPNASVSSIKNTNGDNKRKNSTSSSKINTGQVMEKTIWVGSLNRSITDAALKKYFKQFGIITSVYCPPNEAYAFVNFEKSEHVANVLKSSPHELLGAKLLVRQGVHKK